MNPLVKQTFKQRRWSIFWWSLGIAAFVILELAFYPSIHHQQAQLEKSINFSDSATALFSDTGDLFSPVGYLSGQIFYLMLPLLLGILAIGLGASLVGREEREGTLELILARPISRRHLILAKGFSGVLIVSIVGICATLVTAAMVGLVNLPVASVNILLAGIVAVALAVSFGALAFMITTLGKTARSSSVGLAAIVAIAGYLISSLSSTIGWLHWPSKVFAFAYYHPAQILRGQYNWLNFLFFIAFILVCGLVSIRAFSRRDLNG